MPDAGELTPGRVFGGYRIERLLGRGGMGAVYAAEQLEDGRQVALKVLAAGLTSSADRERFIREGRTAASINHPNTVYVYRTEEIDETPTITMELVNGGTLEEKVERLGPLPIAEAIRDTLQIIDGLDAAHHVGILHRDVKPANCFVGPSGEVKVGDFGLSRPVEQTDKVRLTQTGLFLGTPVFSSPEQLLGDALDVRSDIYAVGATLYYLLTGKLPYEVDSAARLIAMVMSSAPTPLAKHRPDVPDALSTVVMKCLVRQREERFDSYAALRDDLIACLPSELAVLPLGRRAAAAIVDTIAVSLLSAPLQKPVASLFGANAVDLLNADSVTSSIFGTLLDLPLALVWFGVLEGRYGWTPGKRLANARVQRTEGGVPGIRRGLIRFLIFWLVTSLLPEVAALGSSSNGERAARSLSAFVVGMFLLFARARRGNGYAAEHDRLTGTRVVRIQPARAQRIDSAQEAMPAAESEVGARPDAPRLGPYDISGEVSGAVGVLVGIDPQLKRSAWIVQREDGAAPLPAVERDDVRATSARWLSGRRQPGEAWDAFALVPGLSLHERLQQPVSWSDVRTWLHDLTTELLAREADGVSWTDVSTGQLWITTDGRLLVLPFAIADAGEPGAHGGNVVREVVRRVMSLDRKLVDRDQWPLSAHVAVRMAGDATDDLRPLQQALDERALTSDPMTLGRRGILRLAAVVMFAAFGILMFGPPLKRAFEGQSEVRLKSLITYVRRARTTEFQAMKENAELVAIYVAAHFRSEIVGRKKVDREVMMTARDWVIADSIIAAHPSTSPDSLTRANRLVDNFWHGRPPLQSDPRAVAVFGLVVSYAIFSLFVMLLLTVAVQRGMLLRLLSLEVVTSHGERAGRIRSLLRALLSSFPYLLLSCCLPMVYLSGFRSTEAFVMYATLIVVYLDCMLIYRSPGSGLAERITGTRIVPE